MDVGLIFKIAGIAIIIAVMNTVLKQADKPEQAQMLTLAGVVIVLMMIIQLINDLFQTVRTMFQLY